MRSLPNKKSPLLRIKREGDTVGEVDKNNTAKVSSSAWDWA